MTPRTEAAPVARLRPRTLYMRCAENRVEDDYDGGLILLVGMKAGEGAAEYVDARLVLSCAADEGMRDFPLAREEKQNRFFRVSIEEVAYAELPPDPTATQVPTAFELLAQARDAAVRHGGTALAERLTRQIGDGVAAPPA